MTFPNQLFDDLSQMASNAAGLAKGAKDELETLAADQLNRLMAKNHIISVEAFEIVEQMAATAREENLKLAQKLEELEARLVALEGKQA